jgi:hypothetical protein
MDDKKERERRERRKRLKQNTGNREQDYEWFKQIRKETNREEKKHVKKQIWKIENAFKERTV